MAKYTQDWDALGQEIQDTVNRAVSSQDFQRLNETIHQIVDRAVVMGGKVVRQAMDSIPQEPAPSRELSKKQLSAFYGKTGGHTAGGIAKIIGGGLLSMIGLCLLAFVALFSLLSGDASMVPWVCGAAFLAGGLVLLTGGIRTMNLVSRFGSYKKVLGTKTHCTLEKLARRVNRSQDFVRKDLQKMFGRGLFPEGHLDQEQTTLIISDETYAYYERSRRQMEQRKQAEAARKASVDPQLQEVLDRGNAFVAQIRRCNDRIPGEEISRKIDRMEHIVGKIFDQARAHPDVVPDLKKLMDYYLPLTVKLLNAYAEMDAQSIQGQNIQSSKREIEDTIDTLNLAFEKLLDDLFQDTAIDISSDISVLNTMLAQEGLTEDELSQLKKEKTI